MWTRQHKQSNIGRLIVPALCVGVLSYFGFHAYHGEYGLYSKYRMQARAVELQVKLDAVRAQRIELEQRVRLLHDGTLEKDMLDEQARRALNVALPEEVIVMLPRSTN